MKRFFAWIKKLIRNMTNSKEKNLRTINHELLQDMVTNGNSHTFAIQ